MPVTVTANLTDISTVETMTGWSSGSTFGSSGTGLISGDGVFKQGTDSASEKISKNNSLWIQHIGTAQDMSAADTHLYWWLLTAIRPNMTAMEIRIGDSSGNYTGWNPATFALWDGSWKCFVQDLAATPDTSSGTIDLTDIVTLGVLYSTIGSNFRAIENCWVDACRFGTGLTATGTSFSLKDIADDDELVGNKYGILENKGGVIFSQGRITIGSGATTTTLVSDNEVLAFLDGAVSPTLYELNFVGTGNVSDIKDLTLRSDGTTDNARFYLDASDPDADVTIDGLACTRAGLIDFASTSDIQNFTFNNCQQIDPSTGIFKYGTVKNYIGTTGAIIWPSDDTNISDIKFTICDNDIEYASGSDATPSLVNIIHDDNAGDYDINNTSGGIITLVLSGTSNGNSYQGSTVTFSNPKLFKFTLNPSVTSYEWRLYEVTTLGSLVGAVEKDGEEVASADNQTYNYTYSADQPIAIQIIHNSGDYIEAVEYFTLKNSDQDITINLQIDENN